MIKNGYEVLPSIKKTSCMEHVNSVRKKNIANFVEYIKTHVEKISEKFEKSEKNLKKLQKTRSKLLKMKSEKRDEKISKILITRSKKPIVSKRYYESSSPISKQSFIRSHSESKLRKEDLESTDKELEKIDQKLESSYSRAQDYKKAISLSASRRLRKVNSASLVQTENEYRKKLEGYLNRQKLVFESKNELRDKIVSRLRTVNQKKSKAYQKSLKSRNLELKNNEKEGNERIMSETVKLEKVKRSRELQAFESAERWRQRKSNQELKFNTNKQLNFLNKEKILQKVLRNNSNPLVVVSKSSSDLSEMKYWRDSEIYKLKSKLIQ